MFNALFKNKSNGIWHSTVISTQLLSFLWLSGYFPFLQSFNAVPKTNTRSNEPVARKTKPNNFFFLFLPKGMGLINHVFNADSLKKLYVSNLGIGHTRYSTSGISELQNCQPFVVETLHGKIAVAHNGELTNAVRLRRKVSISPGKLQHHLCLSMRQQWAKTLLWHVLHTKLLGVVKEHHNQNR